MQNKVCGPCSQQPYSLVLKQRNSPPQQSLITTIAGIAEYPAPGYWLLLVATISILLTILFTFYWQISHYSKALL